MHGGPEEEIFMGVLNNQIHYLSALLNIHQIFISGTSSAIHPGFTFGLGLINLVTSVIYHIY